MRLWMERFRATAESRPLGLTPPHNEGPHTLAPGRIDMKKLSTFATIAILALCCSPFLWSKEKPSENTTIRIMTFNIWGYGKGRKLPPSRIAEVIKASKADIVGLQENRKSAKALADMLGLNYVKQGRSAALLSRLRSLRPQRKNTVSEYASLRGRKCSSSIYISCHRHINRTSY